MGGIETREGIDVSFYFSQELTPFWMKKIIRQVTSIYLRLGSYFCVPVCNGSYATEARSVEGPGMVGYAPFLLIRSIPQAWTLCTLRFMIQEGKKGL